MDFFGKIVKSLLSFEQPPGYSVTDVSISNYTRYPVLNREDCLVLYGPIPNSNKFDLLLQKSVQDSTKSAFSLFRVEDSTEAQICFLTYREVLIPLIEVMPQTILSLNTLQTLCDTVRLNKAWTVAHAASHLGYIKAFDHKAIVSLCNVQELGEHSTPLHLALRRCDLELTRKLISVGAQVNTVDSKGNTAIHLAAVTNKDIIQLIIKVYNDQGCSKSVINHQNKSGRTPLHLACEADKPECVRALLSAGADVNTATTSRSSDDTGAPLPIHCAVRADAARCVADIIDANPKQISAGDMKNGGTPLHWANSAKMVHLLVDLHCETDATNFKGATALHNMVSNDCVEGIVALLACGALAGVRDGQGRTPIHLAASVDALNALIAFGADVNTYQDNTGATPRHAISISSTKEKSAMLNVLYKLGAERCKVAFASCTAGCAPTGLDDGQPDPKGPQAPFERLRTPYDEFLDEIFDAETDVSDGRLGWHMVSNVGPRVLCLDGGGIKGLILIQLILALEEEIKKATKQENIVFRDWFDYFVGTSTGGILAIALAMGKSASQCQRLYFRLKDTVFVGSRPYDAEPLERILKEEFGAETTMADIHKVRVAVTGVLADRCPADLHLFRNYESGEELFRRVKMPHLSPVIDETTESDPFVPLPTPNKQLVWKAARASGAAPTYFSPFGNRFIDGGLISNNPTLDILTELIEFGAVERALKGNGNDSRGGKNLPSIVVSLGTGKKPLVKEKPVDLNVSWSSGIFNITSEVTKIVTLLTDQATMPDSYCVDRCRAWCASVNTSFVRLSPQLEADLPLDIIPLPQLLRTLVQTKMYARKNEKKIKRAVDALKRNFS